jgi:glycosyltransferase involved in cell wall biosynthesis
MFGAADVVTLPSYNEGLPNVVCEAMLSGRAVVATTVGGIPEIVQHGCTGLLAGAGDVTGLHAALAQVAAAPEERARMEQLALEFAKDKLTWRVSARRYDEVLRQAATAR